MIEELSDFPVNNAVIAMSTNFQDALSFSPIAYRNNLPVILQTWGDTSADRGFTDEAAAWLEGKTLTVIGGTGAISEESVADYEQFVRLWGETGYDTSNEIAKWATSRCLLDRTNVVIACGAQTPKGVDALAGAALAGQLRAPILLVNGNEAIEGVDTTTLDGYLAMSSLSVRQAYVLGGTYVIPEDTYNQIATIIGAE
jgi:putative cell wall-binding protein